MDEWLGLSARTQRNLPACPATALRSGHEGLRAGWPLPFQQRSQESSGMAGARRRQWSSRAGSQEAKVIKMMNATDSGMAMAMAMAPAAISAAENGFG